MDTQEETLLTQFDWDSFFDQVPEFDAHDFLQDDTAPVSVAGDNPSPNDPVLSQIENLLMAHPENDVVFPETPLSESSESEFYRLLEEILVEPDEGPESERSKAESEEGSEKDRTDDAVPDEPTSKKLKRQLRNRDAAVRSRERKKAYVKDLEMKSRYLEGECRRLGHLLQCCYAENNALRLCLQSRGAYAASMTSQESAVLLLEPLLLGSLLWVMGIMCHLSLPLMLCLTAVLPRENIEQKGLRRVTQKGPESNISKCFQMESFVKSRRCRASRTKMKFIFMMF
ncbi:bZIP transcription factor 60 [Vigna unguiculata]|uniref:bZIP transcription factor 60 n=1 Tax=Vigna unguiculata TaxID=3917 RepID=UPI0010162C20|nr:bZIP transcription factor 60 [Vigna unguiculata]